MVVGVADIPFVFGGNGGGAIPPEMDDVKLID